MLTESETRPRPVSPRCGWLMIWGLIVIVVVFAIERVQLDFDGSLPRDVLNDFDVRYRDHRTVAYLHIAPALVYLVLAPAQFSPRIRRRWSAAHRGLGRLLATAGIVSGAFGLAFGVLFPFDGFIQASASAVFGLYFAGALALGVAAARRRDFRAHRAWMVRAFAIATAVGSIRILVGLGEVTGWVEIDSSFGPAFWIGFCVHASAGEAWLRARPGVGTLDVSQPEPARPSR